MNEVAWQEVRVRKGGRIVIPARFRRAMGLEEGSLLEMRVDDRGQLISEPVPPDPVERLRWAFGETFRGIDADEYVGALREEWPD